jgi:hypothetical protein
MASEPAPIPTEAFAALNAWVRSFDPSAEGLMLVYVSHGMKAKIPMPHVGGDDEVIDDPSANLTQMEAAVLEVVRDQMKPGESLSTDEIAKRAGYANSGALRSFLKSVASALKLKITTRGVSKS